MKKTLLAVSALAAFSAFSAFSTNASAAPDGKTGLAACGDIEVSASAQCKAEVSGGCTAKCTPIAFEAKCQAEVQFGGCEGECKAELSAECTGSCGGSCEANCNANPGTFSCQGNCEASCGADCDGQCSAQAEGSKAKADCKASCKASCGGRCEGSCKATPPSADCKAKCEGSCSGSCKAKANASCDIQCTGKVVAECSTRLEGGCKAQCQKPEGALYCDGQYMDKGGNAEDCINALNAYLSSKVDVSATGSASCEGGSCQAEGEAAASCGTIAGSRAVGGEFALGAGLLGLAFGVSRIRRKKLAVASPRRRRRTRTAEGVPRTHSCVGRLRALTCPSATPKSATARTPHGRPSGGRGSPAVFPAFSAARSDPTRPCRSSAPSASPSSEA